ncbi:synaptonemal complex protein 2-like [Hyperolius riggenbachi]|uniref:synaptonemal complex protein 2-like n=1 Tax=Hyperolius riggenbachi TaxID=752182 RepID=UPI0035A36375
MQHKSGTITVSDLDQDIMDPLQEMSSPEGAPLIKSLQKEDFQSGFCSKVAPKEAENDYTVDLQKKRKRTLSGEEELVFKPRKLFGSCDKVADALKEVPQSQSPDSNAAESNFISSFEKFSEDLKNKMMSTYKKMEIQAQDMLTAAQTHMSSLISQIQKCKLHKLQHFCEIVARELATLEADSQTLTDMEKETMEIWEAQTKKIQEFCVNQTQRLEARVGEAQSIVAKNDEEITKVNENSKKLLKD